MNREDSFAAVTVCGSMYRAARAALAYYLHTIGAAGRLVRGEPFSTQDVRLTLEEVENTYFIRMFAQFEAVLRNYWEQGRGRTTAPRIRILIDRLASHLRVQGDVLKRVHEVRESRNHLVHHGMGVAPARVTIMEARSRLCRFLAYLPPHWK